MVRLKLGLLLLPFVSAQFPDQNPDATPEVTPSAVESTSEAASTTSAALSTSLLEPAVPTASSEPVVSLSAINAPPISSYTFSPFPTPSQVPIPGVFPATDPRNPPPVNSPLIPDFAPAWAAAYARAKEKIEKFTLDEKVSVATGVGWQNGRCVGNIPAIEPIVGRGWPGLCLEDAPLGIRLADFVTSFPTGVNTAATFNRRLIRLRGLFMGREHVGKGVNVALGPMMNMGRVAQGGRNWEGFGADPYLAGEASYETILGMQSAGVQACAKHLINNEQEHKRTTTTSDVDDRTQHEIYTHPFLRSVMAGVTSMMCSYNLVNGTYACEDDKIMNDIVKREYGFQGYIMSDWQATHSTVSAITGLDMTMPGDIKFKSGDTYFGANLTAYVLNGTIPESRVDDMGWYLLKQDAPAYPKTNFDAFRPDNEDTNERVDVQADHYKLVREIGAASTVLLKNVNNTLPLKKPRSIVLIGSDAGPGKIGPNQFADQGGNDGVLAMGWGSGTTNFTYLISVGVLTSPSLLPTTLTDAPIQPLDAIQRRAREDRTSVSWFLDDFNLARAGNIAIRKSAAIVFINSNSGEAYITVDGNEGDRKNLTAWHGGDALVAAVAKQNKNTIVVVHSVGPLIVEPWIDHPNVTAVLWAGAPGQEAGNSITDVLYGLWNPSGRLPYTIAKQVSDYSAQLVLGGTPQEIIKIPYTEGLEIDYRHFDAKGITPRFEFGFGLSYTTFAYSNLLISHVDSPDGVQSDLEEAWAAGQASPIEQGSSTAVWLHRPAYRVTFDVTNTGSRFGGEIPQLYLHMPPSSGEPPSLLRGFTNVEIAPGQSTAVTLTLSRYDLSIWDTVAQGWRKPEGEFRVTIGASSRDGRLKGKIPRAK
ncbi:hypothetical protein DXG03_005630 [Asterophora parasitica]|uniref:beta-glucosidase n=1 Tax=Asterophora parasitica TaxID=117018 RepID=A0A9P7G846_9AGAR|nr:hypothetical protein DXG03_005630 [Asterophora parasitica]